MITDPYSILLYLQENKIKCKEKKRIEIDKKKFIQLCEQEQWTGVYNTQSIEDGLDLLIKKLQDIGRNSLKSKSRHQKPRKN